MYTDRGTLDRAKQESWKAPRQDPSVHYPGIEKEPSADRAEGDTRQRTARQRLEGHAVLETSGDGVRRQGGTAKSS